MKSYKHDRTLVIPIEIPVNLGMIKRYSADILNELKKEGISESGNVIRRVYNSNLPTILSHGTDRYRRRDFEEHLENKRLLLQCGFYTEYIDWLKSKNYTVDDVIETCRNCRNTYEFEDIVEETRTRYGEKRLLIRCPSLEIIWIDNSLGLHSDCPVYTDVADSPDVFFGVSQETQKSINSFLSVYASEDASYTHLLIYDGNLVEPFDIERFRFRKGVKRTDALKAVIDTTLKRFKTNSE